MKYTVCGDCNGKSISLKNRLLWCFRFLMTHFTRWTNRYSTNCIFLWYYRIVVHGKELFSGIVPGSAKPFNFKKEFHLSEVEVHITHIITNKTELKKRIQCIQWYKSTSLTKTIVIFFRLWRSVITTQLKLTWNRTIVIFFAMSFDSYTTIIWPVKTSYIITFLK